MTGIEFVGAMLRGVHLGALVSLFGTLLFAVVVLRVAPPSLFVPGVHARQMRLARASTAAALVAVVAWFVERAAAMAGAGSLTETLAALPMVAWHTRFGRVLLLRSILLVILWPLLRNRRAWPLAIFLAGLALGSQAATSHAGAIVGEAGQKLVFVEALHLLAAGAWLGALIPLLLTLSGLPAASAPPILRRFFPIGLGAVSLVGVTSVIQASHLIGSVPALVGTPYGRTTLIKLGLFLLLLGFAALNRFVFGPTDVNATRASWLRRSIVGETVVAGVLMLVAGSLAYQTPGTHVQPEWPFAWRINPDAAGAFLVPAHPASYLASPTGFAAA
jgi:putative copper export protein